MTSAGYRFPKTMNRKLSWLVSSPIEPELRSIRRQKQTLMELAVGPMSTLGSLPLPHLCVTSSARSRLLPARQR